VSSVAQPWLIVTCASLPCSELPKAGTEHGENPKQCFRWLNNELCCLSSPLWLLLSCWMSVTPDLEYLQTTKYLDTEYCSFRSSSPPSQFTSEACRSPRYPRDFTRLPLPFSVFSRGGPLSSRNAPQKKQSKKPELHRVARYLRGRYLQLAYSVKVWTLITSSTV
jgi:hypothetical protein